MLHLAAKSYFMKVIYPVPATSIRSPWIAYGQSAINNRWHLNLPLILTLN